MIDKTDTDVIVKVVDPGTMASRRHLNVRGKSATLPSITDKDWDDLKFGIEVGVDFFALSFVKVSLFLYSNLKHLHQDANVIYELKRWLGQQDAKVGVLAKIESAESIENLEDVLDAVDGAMVARGDLGAELPFERVPYFQSKIIQECRRRGKPVIVATNMLESMIKNPTPTRAEVSDISIAVREGADAVMLSGETAYGKFPFKALSQMSNVVTRTEKSMIGYSGSRRFGSTEAPRIDWIIPEYRRAEKNTNPYLSEMFAYHATTMANTIMTSLIVFTRMGNMPALLSHYRPDYPIFAFTEDEQVQRRLAIYHGITAIQTKFGETAGETFEMSVCILVMHLWIFCTVVLLRRCTNVDTSQMGSLWLWFEADVNRFGEAPPHTPSKCNRSLQMPPKNVFRFVKFMAVKWNPQRRSHLWTSSPI